MTDDIVARLRRPAPDFGLEQYDPTYDDRQEAADKIDRLREAAEMALETLIGCCVSAGGVDDRKTILEAQDMLRAALEGEAR